MSRIYFHSPSGEAELWGGERAWLRSLCSHVAIGLLDLRFQADRLRDLIGPGHYLLTDSYADPQRFAVSLETALTAGMDEKLLVWRDHPVDVFSLMLNTALAVGGDPLKLAARIHGQCEIHAWMEGVDRAWVAQVIDQGLATGVFRAGLSTGVFRAGLSGMGAGYDFGWEEVARFLRGRDDEPVVMSFSVTEPFPTRYWAGWEPAPGTSLRPSWISETDWSAMGEEERENYHSEARSERWGYLPADERWGLAMAKLRTEKGGLRINPARWTAAEYYFGHGLTVFDLLASDRDERLNRALLGEDSSDE